MLQKSLYTQQKKFSSMTRDLQLGIVTYLYSQPKKLLLIPRNMNYSRKNPIYLKQVYTFQSNQIKLENPKSSIPLKRFIVRFLTAEKTKSQIKVHLSYLAHPYFYNYKPSPRILHQHCVLWNIRKNKDIIITKPDNGNGIVILDWKLYDNAIQEIISGTSKIEKLNEDPTLKHEASLRFYINWYKNFF